MTEERDKLQRGEAVDDAVIANVAALSQLALTDEEKEEAKKALMQELCFLEQLRELPPEDTGDAFFALGKDVPGPREDVLSEDSFAERILQNAPALSNNCYVVPRTIGESS